MSEVRVGFEAALDTIDPKWADWKTERIDEARYFYNAALKDTAVFVNAGLKQGQDTIAQGFNWLVENVHKTGANEAEISVPEVMSSKLPDSEDDAYEASVQEPVQDPETGLYDEELEDTGD